MVKEFTIYQVDDSKEESRYFLFANLSLIERMGHELSLSAYKEVWNDEIITSYEEVMDILDVIYQKFNMSKPKGYKGRSLSVSDIVKIENKYYFCDSFGWEEVEL